MIIFSFSQQAKQSQPYYHKFTITELSVKYAYNFNRGQEIAASLHGSPSASSEIALQMYSKA